MKQKSARKEQKKNLAAWSKLNADMSIVAMGYIQKIHDDARQQTGTNYPEDTEKPPK